MSCQNFFSGYNITLEPLAVLFYSVAKEQSVSNYQQQAQVSIGTDGSRITQKHPIVSQAPYCFFYINSSA